MHTDFNTPFMVLNRMLVHTSHTLRVLPIDPVANFSCCFYLGQGFACKSLMYLFIFSSVEHYSLHTLPIYSLIIHDMQAATFVL